MLCPLTLPAHGKAIYDEVYQSARARGASEGSAEKQAWRVVKRFYRKKGDGWVTRKPGRTPIAARGRVLKVSP